MTELRYRGRRDTVVDSVKAGTGQTSGTSVTALSAAQSLSMRTDHHGAAPAVVSVVRHRHLDVMSSRKTHGWRGIR
jgi:hypothetical protein